MRSYSLPVRHQLLKVARLYACLRKSCDYRLLHLSLLRNCFISTALFSPAMSLKRPHIQRRQTLLYGLKGWVRELSDLWNKVHPRSSTLCALITVFHFSLTFSQLWAARSKRIQTPTCVTSRRGRRTTLTGCCFGHTVRRTPAPTCCTVSLSESYLIKRRQKFLLAQNQLFHLFFCVWLSKNEGKKNAAAIRRAATVRE